MKKFTMFVSILLLATLLFGSAMMEEQTLKAQFADPTDAAYLEYYFNVTLPEGPVAAASFQKALSQIVGNEIKLSKDTDVFKALVEAAELGQLAETYSNEKAIARLKVYGITGVPTDIARYLACALDAYLIPSAVAQDMIVSGQLDSSAAVSILMNVAEANGIARNYLGKISDSDILQRIANAFDGYTLYSDGNLDAIGAMAVQQRASTGYNLKKDADDARFLPSRTIQYGHSDEIHLKQLVVLLNSEGIDAKLQLEPKVSIYEYLLDWGPVPEPSPYYMVLEFSKGFYLAYAVEYDAKFEFDSTEDLMKFDGIINKYSKKNDTNQAKGSTIKLIKGAWWQPLYSATFNPDTSAYIEIVDCVLEEDGYSIHPFSLVETKANLINTLESLSGLDVIQRTIFVNNAFHRYLTGSDYQ